MKKTLVAIAALAAATGAMAQSSVEIYGIMDVGYNKITSTGTDKIRQTTIGAGANSGNGSGNLNGSRIGFRGTEDLGNSMKANFVVEYGVNLTGPGTGSNVGGNNGATTAADNAVGPGLANLRQGFVGLSSATLGTVALGTQYAYHDATSGAIAGANAIGGSNNVVGASNLLKYGYTGGQPRLTSAISYTSPAYMGMTLRAMRNEGKAVTGDNTAAPTTAASKSANTANSFAIDYVNGPVKAGLAQTKYYDMGAISTTAGMTYLVDVLGGSSTVAGTNDRVAGASAQDLANITNRVAGAQYDAGFARFGLNRGTYEAAFATAANTIKSGQNMGSVAVPLANGVTLNGGYTRGMLTQGGVDKFKTSAYDLIVVKDLSKRTNVYALYVKTNYASQVTGTNDAAQYQYGVGVRHSF